MSFMGVCLLLGCLFSGLMQTAVRWRFRHHWVKNMTANTGCMLHPDNSVVVVNSVDGCASRNLLVVCCALIQWTWLLWTFSVRHIMHRSG
jgi:hypothetical protein